MKNKQIPSLNITGNANASGGVYDKVKILGEGEVEGDLECSSYWCTGNCTINGNLKAASIRINGTSSLKGNLDVHKLNMLGQIDVDGNASIKELKLNGLANINHNLTGEKMNVKGAVMVKGNCEAETVMVKGSLTIDGLLNAGELNLEMSWPSSIREIGGEKINIRKGGYLKNMVKSLIGIFKFQPLASLTAETIEGDEVYLENTTAKVVRGNRVIIGPGCEIDLVEYQSDYEANKNSRVVSQKKI
jgi:cytoskeletal protein CcmA (bactofilin family)